VVLDLAAQANNDGRAKNDSFIAVEIFDGTWSDDTLKGNRPPNTFNAGAATMCMTAAAALTCMNGEQAPTS
jgi:hypothetical protein